MKFVFEEMLKKPTRLYTTNDDSIKYLYIFTVREKILSGLYRLRDRMLEQGLRNQFWIAMNEEDGAFVDLYPKQSYDLSSEDRRTLNQV